jgi:hypothetical protein
MRDTLNQRVVIINFKELMETLHQLMTQDLEPDPGGGGLRIRDGVAEEQPTRRQLSR